MKTADEILKICRMARVEANSRPMSYRAAEIRGDSTGCSNDYEHDEDDYDDERSANATIAGNRGGHQYSEGSSREDRVLVGVAARRRALWNPLGLDVLAEQGAAE